MSGKPVMTHADRAERQRRVAQAFATTALGSRAIAAQFGMNDSHVRYIARLYGVARKSGSTVDTSGRRVARG